MKFEDFLEKYESEIDYANRMLKPSSLAFYKKTREYWQGYKKAYHNILEFMKGELGFLPKTVNMTEEERKQNIFIDENGNEYIPYKWLEYRKEKVAIYADDYGQQDFIIFRDKEYFGGAYNFCAEYDFCSFIDTIKDDIE